MSIVLALATASLQPEQYQDPRNPQHPRVDYLELQRYIDLDVIDYSAYTHNRLGEFFRRTETYLHSDLYLTLLGLLQKNRYRLVFAMSERAGLPFAGIRRMLPSQEPFVSMFTCWSSRQEQWITRFNLFPKMDSIIVKTRSLKQHFVRLGAAPEKIHVIPLGLDHRFFSPLAGEETHKGFLFSLGEVRNRDYPTLFKAMEGLQAVTGCQDLKLLVAASGSWYAREKPRGIRSATPSNVTMGRRYSRLELKRFYARAEFVVLPLRYELASAGATAVLEAMSMGRAVITTRSPGIQDYVVDGETALLVEPGDVEGLRDAIRHLHAHPAEARRLGHNARQRIVEELNLDRYVAQVARVLRKHTV